jgi:hypothetical protein
VDKEKEKAPKKPSKRTTLRPEPDYKPVDCAGDGDAGCKELNVWAAAWQTWGQTLLKEIDEMRMAICALEMQVYYNKPSTGGLICNATGPITGGGGGPPPTDTGQPPKPPFK